MPSSPRSIIIANDANHNALKVLAQIFPGEFTGAYSPSSSCGADAHPTGCGLLDVYEPLPPLNAVWCVHPEELPDNTWFEYVEHYGDKVAAFTKPIGAGFVIWLGYDWFERNDAAWDAVLLDAIDTDSTLVCAPSTLPCDSIVPDVYYLHGTYVTNVCKNSDGDVDPSGLACADWLVDDSTGTPYYAYFKDTTHMHAAHECMETGVTGTGTTGVH